MQTLIGYNTNLHSTLMFPLFVHDKAPYMSNILCYMYVKRVIGKNVYNVMFSLQLIIGSVLDLEDIKPKRTIDGLG